MIHTEDLASEATSVLPLVGPELDLQSPVLAGGREDLSNSIIKSSMNLFCHPQDLKSKDYNCIYTTKVLDTHPQEIALENVKGLAPDVDLLVGRHLDLPVALGLVGVVGGVVGTLDGNLGMKYDNI